MNTSWSIGELRMRQKTILQRCSRKRSDVNTLKYLPPAHETVVPTGFESHRQRYEHGYLCPRVQSTN